MALIGQNILRTKILNKKIVLEVIRKYQPIPRHEIAEKTKLTRGTISNIVSELINEGLINSLGSHGTTGQAGAGRRSIALELNSNAIHVIGIHVSKKNIQIGLVNLNGHIIKNTKIKIPEDVSTDTFDELLTSSLTTFIKNVGNISVNAIGVGVSGLVDIQNGIVIKSNHIGIANYPIVSILNSRFDIPVYLDNNVKAMAQAEKMFGVGKKYSDFITIYLGEGIGSGMVINNSLFNEKSLGEGEFGHMTYLPDGIPCWCGNRGCLERYVSEPELLSRLNVTSIDEVFKRVKENDKWVIRELENAGEKIGITLTSIINMLHFPVVVFSGNLADEKLPLLEVVSRIINERAFSSRNNDILIRQTSLGENIGLLGAVSLVLSKAFN